MNKRLSAIKTIALAIFVWINAFNSSAQCGTWYDYLGVATPACTGSPELMTSCAWGGDIFGLNVTAGETYTVSTCGGAAWDTEITIWNNALTTVIGFNDDACGLQSEVTFTATATTTVYVLITELGCDYYPFCTSVWVTCGGVNPCNSINTISGCGTTQSSSLSGTGSWDIGACGNTTSGVESIWEFTATGNGIHSLDITGINGGPIDFMWINSLAGCAETAPWNCITTASTPGVYDSLYWQAGETYYILIDPQGTGASDVTFNIDCPPVGGAPSGDCAGAIPICSDENFAVSPNNYGAIDELCVDCITNPGNYVNPWQSPSSSNAGCLLDGELNSTWMSINVQQGGTLEFAFGDGTAGYYFDWIMWPYDANTCTDIQNNNEAPVSCNWNNSSSGYTGVGTVPAGGDPFNFEPAMNVSSGDAYIIMMSNWSSAYTNVPLAFGGTADISCNPLPVEMINFEGESKAILNELTWSTLSEVNCSHFEIERSEEGMIFTKIGKVDGAGTTLEQSDYRFHDTEVEAKMYYYRLKQVDFNGAYEYSDILALATELEGMYAIVSAYPNPTKDVFNIQLYSMNDCSIDVRVTTTNGKEVYSREAMVNKGNGKITIDVNQFERGIYFVELFSEMNNTIEMVKMVVN